MDEKMKEIEVRWPILWPGERTTSELIDAVVAANKDILHLLTRVRELEEELSEWKDVPSTAPIPRSTQKEE